MGLTGDIDLLDKGADFIVGNWYYILGLPLIFFIKKGKIFLNRLKRFVQKIFKKEVYYLGVLIKVKSEAGRNADIFIDELEEKIETQYQKFKGKIIFINLAKVDGIKYIKDATEYGKKHDLDIVLYGNIGHELKENGSKYNDIKIKFSFPHGESDEAIYPCKLKDQNSGLDIAQHTTNLTFVAQHIMGFIALCRGDINGALEIGRELNAIDILFHANHQILHLSESNSEKINYVEKGIHASKEILNIDADNLCALTYLSYGYGVKRERELARPVILKLYQKHKRNLNAMLGRAYLHLLDGEDKKAFSIYRELIRKRNQWKGKNATFLQVQSFINNHYNEVKLGNLKLASGLIALLFGDKDIAKSDLIYYLEKNNKLPKYENGVLEKLIQKYG